MATSLNNKWVLITGASSGFGAAAARAFAAQGSNILIGARRVDRLEQVAADSKKAGAPQVFFHALDVSKTSSVEAFVAFAKTKTQKIDVLVNNAGGAHGLDKVIDVKDEDMETMFQTNALGILRVTRAVLPMMMNNVGSNIINIGSYAGYEVYEGGAAYCGAKAAERMISRTLRLELCGTGIRVSSIDPGLAETEFSVVRFKGDKEKAKKPYIGTEPLTAEDIAEAMVWVASRPRHMNVDEMLIKATDQGSMNKVYRRT
jgi:3-hydroxy acid dehydrogenase / malonic semialdehyde reductase